MTFQYRHRKEIIIAVVVILLILSSGTYYFFTQTTTEESEPIIKKIEKKNTTKESADEESVSVDIKGEVLIPGIYTMKKSSRVIDVIDKAGGLTENADTTVLNLSKKITDEMVIIVYSKEQVKNFEITKKTEEQLEERCRKVDENSLENDACIDTKQENNNISNKVNLNTASKESLMTLTGIGESKAKDIIDYREKNGNYKTIEDIKNVTGIGESIYAQIKENITVG